MKTRTLAAALAAVALGLGAALAVPLSASAHNATLDGVATCQADGTVSIVWTGTTSNVPEDASGTVTVKSHTPPASTLSADSIPVAPSAGFTFTQSGIPGDTHQANVNVDVAWSDGFKQSDTTGHVALAGDCAPPPPAPIVIPILPVVVHPATCDTGVTYDVPVQDPAVKYALLADNVTRPVPGTGFSLPAGQSITIEAHVIAALTTAHGGPDAANDYSSGLIVGGDADPSLCPPPALIPVEIAPATSTDASCDAAATYTLPEQPAGIKYALDAVTSIRPAAGTFTLADGATVTVVAHSIAGYVPVHASWTFTGHAVIPAQSTNSEAPCYVAPEPTPTPTPTPTTDLPTPTALAVTGSDDLVQAGVPALWAAGAGIVLSVLAMLLYRRRDANDELIAAAGYKVDDLRGASRRAKIRQLRATK